MRISGVTLACVALLLILGTAVGFGWGSITHVYIANNLGVRLGPLNQNEMYGAVLPDLFGYDFSEQGFAADYAFHADPTVYWGLYAGASSRYAKAAFYGAFTHNNIDDKVRGADWYAHGVYPGNEQGWVNQQGMLLLAQNASIVSYINSYGIPPDFLGLVGHTLIETAVDILVRRCEDPLVGARLYLAASNRSGDILQPLTAAFSSYGLDGAAAEAQYREQMMGYGTLFILPEPVLISQLATQTIGVANKILVEVFHMSPPPIPETDASTIAGFIRLAIKQVEPVYHRELMATLCNVEHNMKLYGPPPAGPIYAFWKDGDEEEELAQLRALANVPAELALDQNYPNPFNPSTTIGYAVPADSKVTLKVYNTLGQEVATLVDDYLTAGNYTATWQATGLAGGTYFYRLQSASTVLTRKMVLLK